MKQVSIEEAERYLNIDPEDPRLKKIDEKLAEGFNLQEVIEAHREELAQLEETEAYLDIVRSGYDRKTHARQANFRGFIPPSRTPTARSGHCEDGSEMTARPRIVTGACTTMRAGAQTGTMPFSRIIRMTS